MAARPPGVAELPAEFPVFPLEGALLLPRGRLPLNIFEPRYLAMVEDALGGGRLFGMIQPNRHAPPGANGPDLYRIGCLGRLSHFSETDDGRYLITLTGLTRFFVRDELSMRRGYRRVSADYAPFPDDIDAPAGRLPMPRTDLIDALRPYFRTQEIDANWDAIGAMPDDTLVVTLAMLCPFEAAEKQALLEAPTNADRAGDLLALLRMAVHVADNNQRPS